jgi:ABC-type sugar transport system ATPase subunit
MDVPIIELEGVVKSFGPVSVLKGVNLKAYPGKVTALVGDNGAGKSTLIKGLAGVQPYDSGSVRFDGAEVHLHTPREAARLGIEVVYRTSLSPTTSTSCRTCSSVARRRRSAPSTRDSWRRRRRTPCARSPSAP